MPKILIFLLGFLCFQGQQQQIMISQKITSGGGGGTLTLLQHPAVPSSTCAGGTTCSLTLTQSIGTGNLLIITASAGNTASDIVSINVGGSLTIPAGCNFNGTALNTRCGYVLSSASTAGPVVITFSGSTLGINASLREYSCSGGTLTFDTSGHRDSGSDTSPFAGVGLTLGGTNDVILQFSDGVTVDPTAVSTYGNFESNNGVGIADLLNSTSATAPNWTAAGNSGGSTTGAIAIKCQ